LFIGTERTMAWVDWAIVIVLLLSVVGGLTQGFFRSVCAVGGLVLGLALAAWNYDRLATCIMPIVHLEAVANTIAFLLIALLVMALTGLIGKVLSKTLHQMGLGCLDRLAGGVFGFFQGALLITLCILVTVAFYPRAKWLTEARLPHIFFGACHLSTRMSPEELAGRVRKGLKTLEEESPRWLHPADGQV
jgi:membrane protein required for colicin V production